MTETLIGYARCSTDAQDLTAQRDRLRELGIAEDRIYLDHGLTGTTRNRPGLDQAYTIADLAEVFTVSRATVYRTSSEPRLQTRPGNQPEPLPCTPGTPHPNCRPGPPADHRYLAVILNVVFALDGAASPTGSFPLPPRLATTTRSST